MLADVGYTGIATAAETIETRYTGPRQWWAASWSQAPRIAWQHIPPGRRKAARTAAFGLLRALRDPNDGTLTRRPVIGYTTARAPASPVPERPSAMIRQPARASAVSTRGGRLGANLTGALSAALSAWGSTYSLVTAGLRATTSRPRCRVHGPRAEPAHPALRNRHAGRRGLARPAVSCPHRHRAAAAPPGRSGELEECGFGVIDWRALPSPVAVELLRAADRIARDGHTVAFTGRPYRTGPELTVDRRLTVVRYLSGQPSPAATPETASQLLIAALDSLVSRARPIAVVSGQPELSKQDAAQAITTWQATLRPGGESFSVDIYGHDWTLHA